MGPGGRHLDPQAACTAGKEPTVRPRGLHTAGRRTRGRWPPHAAARAGPRPPRVPSETPSPQTSLPWHSSRPARRAGGLGFGDRARHGRVGLGPAPLCAQRPRRGRGPVAHPTCRRHSEHGPACAARERHPSCCLCWTPAPRCAPAQLLQAPWTQRENRNPVPNSGRLCSGTGGHGRLGPTGGVEAPTARPR